MFHPGPKPTSLACFNGASVIVRDFGDRIWRALDAPPCDKPALLFLPAKSLTQTGVVHGAFFSHGFTVGPPDEQRRNAAAREATFRLIQQRCCELWDCSPEALRSTAAALHACIVHTSIGSGQGRDCCSGCGHRHSQTELARLVCSMIACVMCGPADATPGLRVGNCIKCNGTRSMGSGRCVACTLALLMPNSNDELARSAWRLQDGRCGR